MQRLKGWLAAEKPQSLGVVLLKSKLAILAQATLVGSNSMDRIALAYMYLYSALAPTPSLDSHSP
jgi:hypothetical protein